MNCRNTTASGCRCIEHAEGLSLHAPDKARYLQALEACKGRTVLSVLTMPEPLPLVSPPCDNSYLCDCPSCVTERGRQPTRDRRQPWEAKAA